jgi:hypothetical protein
MAIEHHRPIRPRGEMQAKHDEEEKGDGIPDVDDDEDEDLENITPAPLRELEERPSVGFDIGQEDAWREQQRRRKAHEDYQEQKRKEEEERKRERRNPDGSIDIDKEFTI